jgi:hypothetical protein
MRGLAILSCLWLISACDSSPAALEADAASLPDAEGEPDADPGPDTTGETFKVTLGPIVVPPSGENTQCVEKRLTNADRKWIGKLHTRLTGVSHHLIVYKVAGSEERLEPFDCVPFLDTLDPDTGVPVMVTQVHEETLDLPFGVAFGVEAGQMVRLEMHFVNAGETDAMVGAEAVFEVLPDEQFRQEAGFLFVGNIDIDLEPGKATTLGPTFFPIPDELADVKIFGMTGHTHQWGTNVTVDWLPHDEAPEEMVRPVYHYEDWQWNEPPFARYEPALAMPADSGFRFTCEWWNGSDRRVRFGEDAGDEMCFFWSYYYPSKGHKVCAHTEMLGFPLNVCCPGSSLCEEILGQLGQ